MTPELWDRLKPLFEAAVERPPADRHAFIATLDADDELRSELQDLIFAFEAGESSLDSLAKGLHGMVPAGIYSLRAGDVLLGRFRIVRWLGHGGMGDVYEAFDTELSETIALKKIRPEIAQHPAILARFKREVHLARRLTGPNLCRIHELFITSDPGPAPPDAFLTMEYLEGSTLADEVERNGPLSWPRAREIAIEICSALASMHAVGIIHRDLKSRNVMLAPKHGTTRAVLMDFGLAHELSVPSERDETALTVPGAVVGTPSYMAPEQFSGGPLSPATDVYALGVVLYEMLAGHAPFPEVDPVRAAILRAKPPAPPSTARPELPHRCDEIISRCMQFDPHLRYQSALELAQGMSESPPVFRGVWARTVHFARGWITACFAILLGVAVLSWWWIQSQSTFSPDPRALAWYQRGLIALREGSYLKATGELEQAVNLDKRFATAHARLAEAWAELDFTGAAEHEMLVAIEQRQGRKLTPLDEKYFDAIQSVLTRDFARAVKQEQSILQMLPKDQQAYAFVDLGRAQEKAGDIAGAQKSYDTAARLSPDNPAPFVHLGILMSRHQEVAAGEAVFKSADDLYKTLGNLEGRAEVAFQRGHSANERGDSDLARKYLKDCLDLAVRIPDPQMEVRALTQLSNAEYNSNHPDVAVQYADQALQKPSTQQIEYWATDARIRKANALILLNDLDGADALAQQALHEAQRKEHEHAHLIANAQLTMASIRDLRGKRDEQIELAEQAVNYFESFGFLGQADDATTLLVRGEEGKGQYKVAAQDAERFLAAARKANSPADIAAADETVGNVYLDLERYPDALPRYEEALSLLQSIGQDISYQALHCAEVLWRLGRYRDAETMVHSIPEDAAKRSDIALGIETARAGMLLSQLRFTEAYRIADSSLKKSVDMAPDVQFDFLRIKAIAEAGLGMAKESAQDAQTILGIVKQSENPMTVAKANQVRATICSLQHPPEQAEPAAQMALSRFHDSGLRESEWRTLATLAELAREEKSVDQSRDYAKKAVDILLNIEQTWGSPIFQQYRSRPDIQAAYRRLIEFQNSSKESERNVRGKNL